MTDNFQSYRSESDRALAGYAARRRNGIGRAIIQDVKENGSEYIMGSALIITAALLLIWALPIMLMPMTCTVDYHTGVQVCQ